MALEIRKLGDPVLRERCRPVAEYDPETEKLVGEMEKAMALAGGHGLAASQVGVLKRFFIYDAGYGTRCVLNPEIIEEGGESVFEEGCLSLPGLSVPVTRPSTVKVRCTTASGHRITIEPGGFLSRVFQHEQDHLDGKLIIDRCGSEERKCALGEYQELELRRRQAGAG